MNFSNTFDELSLLTEGLAVIMLRYHVADWDNGTVDQIISTLCIHK